MPPRAAHHKRKRARWTRCFSCRLDHREGFCPNFVMGDLLQDHNDQLQKYIMRTFGVKQRTLQRWFKAGVVPNVYRTKGGRGHYRVRMPKGMRVEMISTWELVRSAAEMTSKEDFPVFKYFIIARTSGVPESFVHWFCQLRRNVEDYAHFMSPIWRHERNTGDKVRFYALDEFKKLARQSARPMLEVISSPSSSAFSLETFQPMGENPLERMQ